MDQAALTVVTAVKQNILDILSTRINYLLVWPHQMWGY